MAQALDAILGAAGKHWRKAAAFLIAGLVAGTAYVTRLSYRVEAIEKKMTGVSQSLKEIREGETPYQKRRRQQMRKIGEKLDRLLEQRGGRGPRRSAPYHSPREDEEY